MTTANEQERAKLKKMIADNPPRPFNLDDHSERARLFREVAGYLHTCRREHHGTDIEGRRFAIEAMEQLAAKAKDDAETNARLRAAGL
jgi:hypothetical protein